MATITVKLIGDDELKRKLVGSRADVPVGRFLDRSAAVVQGLARQKAPKDTSRLTNSIGTEKPTNRSRLVGPNVAYGEPVEMGSRPHFPPVAPLEAWARRHGMPGQGFALARKISIYGTPARPYMQPAADESEGKIASLVSVLAAEIESAYQ